MNEIHKGAMDKQGQTTGLHNVATTVYNTDEIIIAGMEALSKPVTSTLGANGRYHAFNEVDVFGNVQTKITNDGVTVAKSIFPLPDPMMNMIALFSYEAASKTAAIAGDGTTRTIAMIQALVKLLIAKRHKNPYKVIAGVMKAVKFGQERIKAAAKQPTLDDIWSIAFTSSHGNTEIADNIRNIYESLSDWKVPIDFEDGVTEGDKVVIKRGYRIGIKSPSIKNECPPRLDNPRIILFNNKLTDFGNLSLNIHKRCLVDNSPVIFIVKELKEDILRYAKEMSETYRVPMYVVKVDTYGAEVDKQFQDLCFLATGRVEDNKLKADWHTILTSRNNIPESDPRAPLSPYYELKIKSALLTNDDCLFEFSLDNEILNNYIQAITDESYEDNVSLANQAARVNRLRSTTCTYYVGGNSMSEIKTSKYLVEDALLAVRSAIKQGVIPGGAWFDIQLSNELTSDAALFEMDNDETAGYFAIVEALRYNLKLMCESGYVDYMEVFDHYVANEELFNFATFQYEPIATSRIMDSAATTSEALKNSASVITHFLKLGSLTY